MQNHLNLFSSLPTLRTKRLTLRPVRMSDAADLYEYSKDPEVARHVLWDAHLHSPDPFLSSVSHPAVPGRSALHLCDRMERKS